MTRIFVFRMRDGRRTTDVEEAIKWLSAVSIVTPEFARQMREDYAAAQGQQSSKQGSWKC